MAEAKTKPTGASVADYIDSRATDEQRADCKSLMAMFRRVTGEKPTMWGPSIVGYGSYRYTYPSGTTGTSSLTGFAIRGKDLVIYLVAEADGQESLLARLGRHRMGKSCLYIRRLEEIDVEALEQLVAGSVAEVRRRYGTSAGT